MFIYTLSVHTSQMGHVSQIFYVIYYFVNVCTKLPSYSTNSNGQILQWKSSFRRVFLDKNEIFYLIRT